MKRFFSFFMSIVLIVLMTGGKSVAAEQKNVWDDTYNYKNRSYFYDEQLVDKETFTQLIGTSNDYLVLPLYDLQDNISAYIIQYYSDNKPLSYIVINTNANVTDDYYVTFGQGDFADVIGLSVVDETDKEIRVCYCGGINFYTQIDEVVYWFNGSMEELSEETVAGLREMGGGNYYNYGETLTQTAVFNKEVGYDSYSYTTQSVLFTKHTMNSTRYVFGSNNPIYNHCYPTAALNMLQFLYTIKGKTSIPMSSWQSVFIDLYTAMGTTNSGTYDINVAPAYQSVLRSYGYNNATASYQYSATWSQVTSALGSCAVHLCLHDSEIYIDHGVLGVGYISFSHSTGWVSKYYSIVDGWTADIRYVHSSLGIDHINLITVNVGS